MFVIKVAVKCVLEKNGEILLIKESGNSSWKPGKWGLPGGKIDPKENFLEAIQREMIEETGIQVVIKGLFRIEELVETIDNEDKLVHHYIFIVKKSTNSPIKSTNHTAEIKWFTQEDLKKLSLTDYTEYYYIDLLQDYIKNKRRYVPLSLIKIRDTKRDRKFLAWLRK